MRFETIRAFVCFTALLLVPLAAIPAKPNIVFIIADDLGYGDLGCYNPEIVKELKTMLDQSKAAGRSRP